MCQRAHDPVFPVDRVGAWQQMAKGLPPQNIRSGGGGEFVGRVGLAALEPLSSERATEPGDAIARAGKRVTVVEARDRCGGRIYPFR